ncbi:MAG: DegV family protein [Solirubrobacterales bacterium]
MAHVAVVADTTSYVPAELTRERGIELVSLYVNWDDRSERESDMADFDEFYARLRTSEQPPTTSQPSIGDFLEVYEPLIDAGRDIVSVHISGQISGTVDSARQAAERLAERTGEQRIHVVDSTSVAGGMALVVLAAASAAMSGASAEEVAKHAQAARAEVKMWFSLDTLEYLRRGGRIGAASAWLGSALKIKPILTVDERIEPIERVRTSARALQRLLDYLQQCKDDGADGWLVQHIQAPDQAAKLAAVAQEIMGTPPLLVSEVGPVLGTHGGPGMLGVGAAPAKYFE